MTFTLEPSPNILKKWAFFLVKKKMKPYYCNFAGCVMLSFLRESWCPFHLWITSLTKSLQNQSLAKVVWQKSYWINVLLQIQHQLSNKDWRKRDLAITNIMKQKEKNESDFRNTFLNVLRNMTLPKGNTSFG